MRVRLVGEEHLTPEETRHRVERRVRLVVGRRSPSVNSVEVQVTREASFAHASGPPRHRCRIRARLTDGSELFVDEEGADVDSAVDVASWRLDRRLGRPPT